MIGEGVLHFLSINNHIFYHCTTNPVLHSSHSILLMKAPSVLSVLIVSCDQWFELWAVCIVNQSRRGVTFTGRVTLLFVQKDFYWAPTMPGLTNSASHVTLSRSLDTQANTCGYWNLESIQTEWLRIRLLHPSAAGSYIITFVNNPGMEKRIFLH